jgi:agmatine deiminase
MSLTPASLGFTMPAEWTPHAATWMGWPFDDVNWEGYLEAARADFTQLIRTIANYEKVYVSYHDQESLADAKRRLGQTKQGLHNIYFRQTALDDIWFRDSGPMFIQNPQGKIALTDWQFNAWGNRFEWHNDIQVPKSIAKELNMKRFEVPIVMEGGALDINNRGVLLTTKQCLLNKNRNPHLSQPHIEQYLKDYLGAKQILWLEKGLEGDKTDGHVDTITRFAADDTIITSICEDKSDSNYEPMQENLELLKKARQSSGHPYNIIELPLPTQKRYVADERLPMTYANFYIGNGFVVMPTYNEPNDQRAQNSLQHTFPTHKVIALPSLGIIAGGGSFHCVTQQQPTGDILNP